MAENSKIEWTDATWNFISGCTRVDEGCRHCYAEREAGGRLQHQPRYHGLTVLKSDGPHWTGEIRMHHDRLDLPLSWRRPRMIFVNSMSDLFHPALYCGRLVYRWADVQTAGLDLLTDAFSVMRRTPHHTYQILTKRPEVAADLLPRVYCKLNLDQPLANVWILASCHDQPSFLQRYAALERIPAAVRGLSIEPMLGPVDLLAEGLSHRLIDWVICGGESGPNARPMHPLWARRLRDDCQTASIPFFFKQWGECKEWTGEQSPSPSYRFPDGTPIVRVGKRAAGRQLDGRTHDAFPEVQRA